LSEKNDLRDTKNSQAAKWNYKACGYKVSRQNVWLEWKKSNALVWDLSEPEDEPMDKIY